MLRNVEDWMYNVSIHLDPFFCTNRNIDACNINATDIGKYYPGTG